METRSNKRGAEVSKVNAFEYLLAAYKSSNWSNDFHCFYMLDTFLILDEKFQIPPETELMILIPMFLMAGGYAFYSERKIYKAEGIKDIENSEIIEIHCQCRRAAMLGDPEDFGNGYFIEVEADKTLFLMSQNFYEIEFPNIHFKIVIIGAWRSIFKIELLGETFESETILARPSIKEWGGDDFPKNGDIINKSLDQIIIERQNITP